MPKEIVPNKLVISFNDNGNISDSILQYRVKIDGVMDNRKFYTMGVSSGIDVEKLNNLTSEAKLHVEKGEKIK